MLIRFPAGSSVKMTFTLTDVSSLEGGTAEYVMADSPKDSPFLTLKSSGSQVILPYKENEGDPENRVRVYLLPADTDGKTGWKYHELRIRLGVEGGVIASGVDVRIDPTITTHAE